MYRYRQPFGAKNGIEKNPVEYRLNNKKGVSSIGCRDTPTPKGPQRLTNTPFSLEVYLLLNMC